VLFLFQRDDELMTREGGLALCGAFGSAEKKMHMNPSPRVGIPLSVRNEALAFLKRHFDAEDLTLESTDLLVIYRGGGQEGQQRRTAVERLQHFSGDRRTRDREVAGVRKADLGGSEPPAQI
jgi:hypothetical protein